MRVGLQSFELPLPRFETDFPNFPFVKDAKSRAAIAHFLTAFEPVVTIFEAGSILNSTNKRYRFRQPESTRVLRADGGRDGTRTIHGEEREREKTALETILSGRLVGLTSRMVLDRSRNAP